jgi:hypothetical protein
MTRCSPSPGTAHAWLRRFVTQTFSTEAPRNFIKTSLRRLSEIIVVPDGYLRGVTIKFANSSRQVLHKVTHCWISLWSPSKYSPWQVTQKETAIDEQHSCETLIWERHETILRFLSTAATARTRWRVRELYCQTSAEPLEAHTYLFAVVAYKRLYTQQNFISCVFTQIVNGKTKDSELSGSKHSQNLSALDVSKFDFFCHHCQIF